MDYRAFNKLIIKDKFPIPLVNELLEDLVGSIMFSKVDLRFSYHQIRMTHKMCSRLYLILIMVTTSS
jgi:hypothetical protein